MPMQNSSYETLTIQPIGSQNPTTLAKAPTGIPLRVLTNNVGPVVIFVATATTELFPLPSTATYRIFPGEQHVFVLAPKQSLYAVGVAIGGLASISTSEALPVP